ncbi:hypothetical protein IFR05_010113 [Cadophora sp. M221]|nr:hypothetical protein IFR05_010113 [Cadophora sp. M221]
MSDYQVPVVTLDTTLAELYKKSLQGSNYTVSLVASFPDGLHLSNQRYVFHDEEIIDTRNDTPAEAGARKARYFLEAVMQRAIGTQKLAFCAGSGVMVQFSALYPENSGSFAARRFERAVIDSLKVLHQTQVPSLIPTRETDLPVITKQLGSNDFLALRIPVDRTPESRCVIAPDLHYKLLSKRELANSGLQTPRCDIIDLGTDAEIAERQADEEDISQDPDHLLDAAIITKFRDDVLRAVRGRNSSFILKLQHTVAGVGTFLVKSAKDQNDLISRLPLILDYILGQTNAYNLQLRPSSVIISDLVSSSQDPPISYTISMFVHRNGQNPDFICCVEQDRNVNNIWEGASIDYSWQTHFEAQFKDRIMETSRYLQSHRHFGPVGIDIVVDTAEKQWIVDLTVRAPGSLALGLLQNYLWKNGQPDGFKFAKLISLLRTGKTKAQFLEAFKLPIIHGSMILMAWWSENENGAGNNFASLILAGSKVEGIQFLEDCLKSHG